ncbi:MAG: sigma-54-dependent Fis family transcriptional regulator [Myxococcales bacterium]|nr:sigma-54-dependent Fis family transcriptional regulator [Myxococcales bacterium]MBK7196814.1 sigma-54-dependent Fis family transcriptional regulator [Myxococcales bacterium]
MTAVADSILVVDDDADILTAARLLLKRHVGAVTTSNQPERIPALLAERPYDAILLDMNFAIGAQSGREGLSWLGRILELDPQAVVVLMTAYSAIETAVEAMKLGAFDFVAKPWQNEKLLATVRAAVGHRQAKLEAAALKATNRALAAATNAGGDPLLGDGPAMRRVFELVAKAAPTDANVLILGENGTGKELVARALHRRSARAEQVFMGVDLGAVSETLIESELFGHKKGAFTGATDHRVGRFQAAAGGTLFLDELGNLPRHLQPKLLTALERREVIPVGANSPVAIDVRVISATNTPRADLEDGAVFRQDLLYRLNTVEIVLPPLRERKEDIPLLADHFRAVYAKKYGRPVAQIADDALAAIVAYPWPGNVRALRHAFERAVILCDGQTLRRGDFPLPAVAGPTAPAVDGAGATTLAELERQAIATALARHAGNITYAAQELGITRTSLYRRMEKHRL